MLESQGCVVEATSINEFRRLPPLERLLEMEQKLEETSRTTLYQKGRYYPGFFVVWAKRL